MDSDHNFLKLVGDTQEGKQSIYSFIRMVYTRVGYMPNATFKINRSIFADKIAYTYACLFKEIKLRRLFSRMLCHIKHARPRVDVGLNF